MSHGALLAAYLDDDLAPKKVYRYELDDGIVAIETRQNVEGLVEMAKAMQDIPPDREFRHVAFVPDAVFDQAVNEGWLHDKKAWKKWLNDADNRAFRTWQGRL